MLDAALAALEGSALAEMLRASRNLYPVVNAAHIMALGTLFGSILAFDLRLLGLFGRVPLSPLMHYLPRVAGCGLALAAATGLLLFSVRPFDYAANPAFLIKIALVLAGTIHAAAVQFSPGWSRAARGEGAVPLRLRLSAALSILIWTAAILAGRFIAF